MIIRLIIALMYWLIDMMQTLLPNLIELPMFVIDAIDWLRSFVCYYGGPMVYIIGKQFYDMYLITIIELLGALILVAMWKGLRHWF